MITIKLDIRWKDESSYFRVDLLLKVVKQHATFLRFVLCNLKKICTLSQEVFQDNQVLNWRSIALKLSFVVLLVEEISDLLSTVANQAQSMNESAILVWPVDELLLCSGVQLFFMVSFEHIDMSFYLLIFKFLLQALWLNQSSEMIGNTLEVGEAEFPDELLVKVALN